MDDLGKTIIKNSVETTLQLIETTNAEVENGTLTLAEAQEKVKRQLLGEMDSDGKRALTYPRGLGRKWLHIHTRP